ncbi:MAG: AAA family ATPase [Bacillota bacterium]|jgi:exonuclease SbcC
MNAIKSIEIQNFQSHQNTKIVLAPAEQLTIVTGQTDSGKTAIFRALRWLLYNTPQGSDFIRAGCKFCRVTAEMESGHAIIREMTASKNQYRIIAPGAEKPVILEGFGRSVPVEVQEITGVKTVTIGDMDFNLNMAEQLDGPFLGNKSVSSGTRAKVMGKLAGTEVLDFAGKNVGTDLFRRNQDEKRLAREVNGLQDAVAQYNYLPALAAKIEAVGGLVEAIKANAIRREQLCLIKIDSEGVTNLIAECNKTINRWQFVEMAGTMAAKIAEKMAKTMATTQFGQQLKGVENIIGGAERTIYRLKNVDAANNVAFKVSKQVQLAGTLSNAKNRLTALDVAVTQCQSIIKRLANVEQTGQILTQVDDKHQRLNQILQLSQNMDIADLSIKRVNDILQRLIGLDDADQAVSDAKTKTLRLNQLSNLKAVLNPINYSIVRTKTALNKLAGLNVADVIRSGLEVATINRRDTLFKLKAVSTALDRSIDDLKGSVIIHEQRVAELEGVYKDELTALGVCPTCGAVTNPLAKAN